MNNTKRKPVSTTHHFGYLNHNKKKKFGFIRISKCGSTSFTSSETLGLNSHFRIKEYEHTIYAAIRDPISRFLSSVPETLSRFKCCSIDMKYPETLNLDISHDIVEILENHNTESAGDVLWLMLDIIENIGFFDAHHEPQNHFLTDLHSRALNNIQLFQLNNAEQAAQEIYTRHIDNGIFKLTNENSGLLSERKNTSFFKRLKERKRASNINSLKNPMYAWGIRNKIPHQLVRNEFYKAIKAASATKAFKEKISCIYDSDKQLFARMQSNIFTMISKNQILT